MEPKQGRRNRGNHGMNMTHCQGLPRSAQVSLYGDFISEPLDKDVIRKVSLNPYQDEQGTKDMILLHSTHPIVPSPSAKNTGPVAHNVWAKS